MDEQRTNLEDAPDGAPDGPTSPVDQTPPPPDGGIAETVRWATTYGVSLDSPPWEDAFCGSVAMCVYAGMVDAAHVGHDAHGCHIEHHVTQLDRKRACKRHAEWLIMQLMKVTERDGGGPPTMSFPTAKFLIAVVDATEEAEPIVELFDYDRTKTLAKSKPSVIHLDERSMQRVIRARNSHMRGIDIVAVNAFRVELANVVRDHLERRRVQTEAALEAVSQSSPDAVQEEAEDVAAPAQTG